MKFKKLLKCSLALALVFGVGGVVSGCDSDNSDLKNNDKQYEIYKLAVEAGITDLTYEEWLVSIKGDKGEDGHTPVITIGSNGNWFVDGIDTNVKASGSVGESGSDGATWLSGDSSPSSQTGKNGDFYFDLVAKKIYLKENNSWIEKLTISNGENGKKIELDINNTHVQWRYEGDSTWNQLISLSSLSGEDGKSVELRSTDLDIEWRYVGDNEWKQLASLQALKGQDGKDGTVWITGEGNPYNKNELDSKVGDFYFDTLNNDIYLLTTNGWVLEVDLEEKYEEKDVELASGKYTGNVFGFSFEAQVEMRDYPVITELLLDGMDASLVGVQDSFITIDGKVITIHVLVSYGGDSFKYSADMILKDDNEMVPFVSEEELGLLKGVYQDYDVGEARVLTLSNKTFALCYDYTTIKGTWEVNYANKDIGEYGLVLTTDDGRVLNFYVNYFYRTMYLDSVGSFSETVYEYKEGSFIYTLGEEGPTVQYGGSDPIKITSVYSFEDNHVNYLHLVDEYGGNYLLDYISGKVYGVVKNSTPFIGTVYTTELDYYEIAYQCMGDYMEMVGSSVSYDLEYYNVHIDFEQYGISIYSKEGESFNCVYDGNLQDFVLQEDAIYKANGGGVIVTINLYSDGTISSVLVEQDPIYNPGGDPNEGQNIRSYPINGNNTYINLDLDVDNNTFSLDSLTQKGVFAGHYDILPEGYIDLMIEGGDNSSIEHIYFAIDYNDEEISSFSMIPKGEIVHTFTVDKGNDQSGSLIIYSDVALEGLDNGNYYALFHNVSESKILYVNINLQEEIILGSSYQFEITSNGNLIIK